VKLWGQQLTVTRTPVTEHCYSVIVVIGSTCSSSPTDPFNNRDVFAIKSSQIATAFFSSHHHVLGLMLAFCLSSFLSSVICLAGFR
jgi:hypothetical protein